MKKKIISILYFILIHLISKCCNLLQEYLLCSYCVVIVPISDYYFFVICLTTCLTMIYTAALLC